MHQYEIEFINFNNSIQLLWIFFVVSLFLIFISHQLTKSCLVLNLLLPYSNGYLVTKNFAFYTKASKNWASPPKLSSFLPSNRFYTDQEGFFCIQRMPILLQVPQWLISSPQSQVLSKLCPNCVGLFFFQGFDSSIVSLIFCLFLVND